MTEFRFLNGNDATRYTAQAASRLLAANLASVVNAGEKTEAADLTTIIRRQIAALVAEHRELDGLIARFGRTSDDELKLRRLKKQKLHLKDQIAQLEDRVTPDIIA